MFTVETADCGKVKGSANKREFLSWIRQSSYFLDPATMKWFGTLPNSLELVNGIVLIGRDTKCPEGVNEWWARVFTDECDAEHIGDRFPTRNAALNAAREYADKVLTDPRNN